MVDFGKRKTIQAGKDSQIAKKGNAGDDKADGVARPIKKI